MIDERNGSLGGMIVGRGNKIKWRKPISVSHFPPQIPHD
jgi:hypothetical protein